MIWRHGVTFVNARVVTEHGLAESVRFKSKIASIGERPESGDASVDVDGAFVLPGLVNAHDHLELNHYGRLKFADRYCNASEWIDDMRPRLAADPSIRAAQQHSLADRVFIGVLKNVLSGATTVAHHNPPYREVQSAQPIRIVQRYGWAHSFFLQDRPAGADGEPGGDVAARFHATPTDAPFFVHLAEGIDAAAYGELARLQASGALAPNTVLVHALAIDAHGWRQVRNSGAGIVWCPASNEFLFGRTIDGARLTAPRSTDVRVALGTDSRLTGSRDLLDELRVAAETPGIKGADLLPMVTTAAAELVRQPLVGRIRAGAPADLIVVPRAAHDPVDALLAIARRDLELVVVGGRPVIGSDSFADVFRARGTRMRHVFVDGIRKIADASLAQRIASCSIAEPGVGAA